jgi:hypothetical protein
MSQLTDQMIQSAAWLRDAQDEKTGGWGATPGATHLSSLNTAEAIIALIKTDRETREPMQCSAGSPTSAQTNLQIPMTRGRGCATPRWEGARRSRPPTSFEPV